ncbi:hypothetical protein GCM10015535_03900 [Streptomyces gelaticus]|uniref:Uncharacterized protein n=1 Tax=Streptomyces gelaticus TaxID=285446 RepID=A0ABQ2VRD1_9ACTN|nr:hypothetical protein GCM10015535_03900 [Streptomyces gelaticus]
MAAVRERAVQVEYGQGPVVTSHTPSQSDQRGHQQHQPAFVAAAAAAAAAAHRPHRTERTTLRSSIGSRVMPAPARRSRAPAPGAP